MGYVIKAGIGAALFLGSIVLFNVKLVELLETGTCASGNTPYEIARPCPEGTGTDMLLLTGSVFGGLIGAAIFAFRGDPPWGPRRPTGFFGLGTLAWGLFFAGTGATALYTSLTNDTIGEDGELGGMIVGITFLLMGVPALLLGLWNVAKTLRSPRDEGPASAAGASRGGSMFGGSGLFGRMQAGLEQAQQAQRTGQAMGWSSAGSTASAGSGDTISKIERLQKLRESGAIDDAEFEREKAKVLAQG